MEISLTAGKCTLFPVSAEASKNLRVEKSPGPTPFRSGPKGFPVGAQFCGSDRGEGGLVDHGIGHLDLRNKISALLTTTACTIVSAKNILNIGINRCAISQIEYCRNFIFKRNFPLHKLFERGCELGLWRLSATTSQPRSLLSMARLNIAKSRVRPSICSLVRIDRRLADPEVEGATCRSGRHCACGLACRLRQAHCRRYREVGAR